MFNRCTFCKRIVWFWQSKAYLDAKSKKPCHAYCWVWEMTTTSIQQTDRAIGGMMLRERVKWRGDDIDELQRAIRDEILKEGKPFIYHRKKKVETVEDDTWRRGVEK